MYVAIIDLSHRVFTHQRRAILAVREKDERARRKSTPALVIVRNVPKDPSSLSQAAGNGEILRCHSG
jgi:hypothetical protein